MCRSCRAATVRSINMHTILSSCKPMKSSEPNAVFTLGKFTSSQAPTTAARINAVGNELARKGADRPRTTERHTERPPGSAGTVDRGLCFNRPEAIRL